MADFRWKDNQANTGTVRASDRREALRSLASRGIEPNELIEDKSSASPKRSGSPEAASDLISRLKPLLKSGLTAGEALRTLSKRSADPKTASLAKEIWQETASGIPLHASVGTERGFPSHASALLRAGEAAGDLTTAFESLDALMRRRKQARQAALAAIAYPALIACMAYAVLVLFVALLLPKLEEVAIAAAQTQGQPAGGLAATFARQAVVIVPIVTVIIVSASLWVSSSRSSASAKARKDAWLLKTPVLGQLIGLSARTETCAVLASLLRGGVPLSEAMAHAAEACTFTSRSRCAAPVRTWPEGNALPPRCWPEGSSLHVTLTPSRRVRNPEPSRIPWRGSPPRSRRNATPPNPPPSDCLPAA
jgi:type II secretory pathway component PulF